MESADQETRVAGQRDGIEGAGPCRRLAPAVAESVDGKHVEHAVAIGGENNPPVVGPDGRLVPPRTRSELGDRRRAEVEEEEIRRAMDAVGGPVGGEDDPSPVRTRARVEILEPIGGERQETTLGNGDAIEIGYSALGESTDDDAVAVGQPVW